MLYRIGIAAKSRCVRRAEVLCVESIEMLGAVKKVACQTEIGQKCTGYF